MDGTEKFWLAIWTSLFATIIAICLIISYTSITNAPLTQQEQQLSSQERTLCIKEHGTWAATDNDNSSPYSCKFIR